MRRGAHVVDDGAGATFLLDDRVAARLGFPQAGRVVSRLDGSRDEDAVLEGLESAYEQAAALSLITRLRRAGWLDERPPVEARWPESPPPAFGLDGLEDEPLDAAAALLHEHGVDIDEGGPALVLTPHLLHPGLADIDAVMRSRGRRWRPICARGVGTVGPWLGGDGPCWTCLAHRLRLNPREQAWLRLRLDAPDAFWPSAPSPATLDASLAAAAGPDGLVDVEHLTRHPVPRRPQCPQCGDPTLVARTQRAPRPLAHRRPAPDGRATEPPQLEHHVGPLVGLVERLSPSVHGLVDAGRPPVHRRSGPEVLVHRSLGRSGVSALCEGLERYAVVFQGDEALRTASLAELGEEALAPAPLQPFSDRQREGRTAWNATCQSPAHRVPEPLDPGRPISWTPLREADGDRVRWMPAALAWYGAPDLGFGRADSNGVAAGATWEEALYFALLEAIERDAVAMWWYHRVRRPALDPSAWPVVEAALTAAEHDGREAWLLDLGHDLGVPVVAAVSALDGRAVSCGFAAHSDPTRAAVRAIGEMGLMRPTLDAFSRGLQMQEANMAWLRADIADRPFLAPAGTSTRSAAPVDDVAVALRGLLERLRGAGLTCWTLNHSRPDVDLVVARAVVPGLRHFWPRLGPGRLYDVPLRLGWIDAPTAEEDLNPLAFVF